MPDNPARGPDRRQLLAALAAAPLISSRASAATNPDPVCRDEESLAATMRVEIGAKSGTRLVLLGTGAGPALGRSRHMMSAVMVHDKRSYLLDCGLGVTDRFARTGMSFRDLQAIFITHHHPDHNIEYGPLLVMGWIHGLNPAVQAFGPPPLTQMTRDYLASMRTTIDFWAEDLHLQSLQSVATHEISSAGPVMQDDLVKVSSLVVQHPPVRPALAYRFDFLDRSIVFSGDTVALPAMAVFAKGADVLVHEAMYPAGVEREGMTQIAQGMPITLDAFMAHMRADHASAEDVGAIAAAAGVKTLVLAHLAPSVGISNADWKTAAAKHYKGEIIVGEDMMVV